MSKKYRNPRWKAGQVRKAFEARATRAIAVSQSELPDKHQKNNSFISVLGSFHENQDGLWWKGTNFLLAHLMFNLTFCMPLSNSLFIALEWHRLVLHHTDFMEHNIRHWLPIRLLPRRSGLRLRQKGMELPDIEINTRKRPPPRRSLTFAYNQRPIIWNFESTIFTFIHPHPRILESVWERLPCSSE